MKAANTLSCLLAVAGLFSAQGLRCQDAAVASVRPIRVREITAPAGVQKQLEPSGLVLFKNQLLIVSDEKDVADVYQLTPRDDQTLQAEPFLSLPAELGQESSDLEGITFCGKQIYVVDEATSTVVEIRSDGEALVHSLKLSTAQSSGDDAGASESAAVGMEGIACDNAADILYLAWERQPRMIYAVDRSSFRVLDAFDVPAGWQSPRSEGGKTVYADFADLYFEDGFLYALQRSDRTILKIAPREKRLVSKLRLDFEESLYYEYNEPFGMAEGLFITSDRIYIVLDNNGTARIGNPQNTSPLLLEFARPAGF